MMNATSQSAEYSMHIRANVYRYGRHSVYAIRRCELASFIALHGWTVANDLGGLTDDDRAELDRLGNLDSIEIPDRSPDGTSWSLWHKLRCVASTPCLTPDM
jgi:hypothetical protein